MPDYTSQLQCNLVGGEAVVVRPNLGDFRAGLCCKFGSGCGSFFLHVDRRSRGRLLGEEGEGVTVLIGVPVDNVLKGYV